MIGQAQGILIERHSITAGAAFRMLMVARQTSRKLCEIAAELILTGDLTELTGQPTKRGVVRLGTSPG